MSGFGLSGRLYTSRDKRSGVHVARPCRSRQVLHRVLGGLPARLPDAWEVRPAEARQSCAAPHTRDSTSTTAHQEGSAVQHMHFASLASRARIVLLVVVTAACGDSPTSPSRYPRVAGSYIGDVTISARSLGVVSVSGINRMEATQSGNQVTIGGVFAAIGEGIETPSITGTINETGVFTPTAGAGATLGSGPSCGTWMLASAAISFSGRSMQIQETMETDRCGVIRLSGTLTRRG